MFQFHRKLLLVIFFVNRIAFSHIHANNNVNIGVTINKNIYYINDGHKVNSSHWGNASPELVNNTPSATSKPKSKQEKPKIGGGRISDEVEEEKDSLTCKCGRTDVQEPLHFDYTSRLGFDL